MILDDVFDITNETSQEDVGPYIVQYYNVKIKRQFHKFPAGFVVPVMAVDFIEGVMTFYHDDATQDRYFLKFFYLTDPEKKDGG